VLNPRPSFAGQAPNAAMTHVEPGSEPKNTRSAMPGPAE
jgi:hypothetical protein